MRDLAVVPKRWRDRGFSTLEIIVAITILGVLLAAVGPQFVNSQRASNRAKLIGQAKGVLQGQLDAMRALPFRVAPAAGDYLDVLDTYYRNTTTAAAAPVCGPVDAPNKPLASWTGYVPAASSARCGYEPAGAFYRYVIAPGTSSLPANFAIVLNTQFVSATTPSAVLAPVATYNSQIAGRDRSPVQQVGVTATAMYSDHGAWKPVTVYTQIAAQTPAVPQIKLAAGATAVQVGSAAAGGAEALTMTGGQMELTGSVFNTSEAKASLTSMSAASSTAGRQSGAALAVSAPYTNIVNLNAGQGDLVSGCSSICWGASVLTPFVLSADNGLPRAGVAGIPGLINPVQTLLPDNVTRDGFRFRTGSVTLPGLSQELVTLDATPPVGELLTDLVPSLVGGLYQCAPSLTGPLSHVTASGYLNSTDETAATGPLSVDACGAAGTNVIRVLPTATAPDGLIRLTVRSSARCQVSGAAHTPSATADYRAEVEYWKWTPSILFLGIPLLGTGVGQYVSAGVITPATATDPLAAVNPALVPVSDTNNLGDYLESWAGLTSAGVQKSVTGRIASLAVPAVVTLQTKPVRGAGDPASAVSLAVGTANCYAEDNR
ncbi:type II secretion system protein [Sporichthya sp.]|uniref:type II secretion system protein n=1 Tax=Sporichthya sp. TaxID=65475 RepID=UPI00182FEFD4|nr:type II secretion system protein [Sporichthya sp.]MBA3742090.1 type II secretion system protein [Sporichthya sp.]